MLSFGGGSSARSTGSGGHSRSASASGLGRRSGEITIEEEDEDAVADEEEMDMDHDGHGEVEDDVEEVEAFSPLVRGPGEEIEERIYEEGEEEPDAKEEQHSAATTKTPTPAVSAST